MTHGCRCRSNDGPSLRLPAQPEQHLWAIVAVTGRTAAYRLGAMAYVTVNGLDLYYETHGSGRPLVLLHGGLMTIGSNFGPLLEPLAAGRQVIAVELPGSRTYR